MIVGNHAINEWLNRNLDKIPLQDLVHHKTKEVIAPLIPQQIRAILPEFLTLIKRPIFKQEFERRMQKADGQDFTAMADVHQEAKAGYKTITEAIANGIVMGKPIAAVGFLKYQ